MLVNGLEQLAAAASQIIEFAGQDNIIVLEGQMGAGKTTLAKAICRELGITDTVNSPTFSLVNEYHGQNGMIVFHFDFYRIANPQEAIDIGIEEYFYSGNYCLLEWASLITELLPQRYIHISIEITAEHQRVLNISRHE